MWSESPIHVLLVSFPAQGHINPLLRLGKCLASKGLFVTFTTTDITGQVMQNANNITHKVNPVGDGFLQFEFFQDGWDDDDPRRTNLSSYLPQLELAGKQVIAQMIKKHAEENHPISCIINNPFFPWVCDVASDHGVPSAMLWIQSGAVFTAYYHFFHKLVSFPSDTEPYIDVQLPSLPLLKYNEIPDFLHPFTSYPFLGTLILEQFKNLSKPFCVLMDTFEELEQDYINFMSKFFLIRTIGPLFKNPRSLATSNIRGDFMKTDDCTIEWLNSKPPASVVYISFGSIVHLPQEQVNEIAHGLLNSEVSFLWVLKPPRNPGLKSHILPDGFFEKTRDKGKVVKWSPQEEVLAHPSVACFITHCGWNSSMEAITSGVPVLTFPAWGDQVTNAKFLVDVFGVGMRLGYGQAENKFVTRDEVKKSLLEVIAGPKGEQLKQNALRRKRAAEAAVADGGSSDQNLDAFVEDIKNGIAVNNF